MKRIKVLQVVAGLDIGRTFGGAERIGVELARHSDCDAFDMSVCSFWQCRSKAEAHWLQILDESGIPHFFATHKHERRGSVDFFQGAPRLVEYCRDHQVDIIHAHHQGGALAAWWVARHRYAQAIVRTVHVPLAEEWGKGPIGWLCRLAFSRILFPIGLEAEVTISPDHQQMLSRRFLTRILRRPPLMIHSAWPQEAVSAGNPGEKIPDRIGPIIGSVGRLTPQKGHAFLIEAMPCILIAIPNAELWLVGEGELQAALQKQAIDRGVADHVRFLGCRSDVPALLEHMDVFALPSLWEGIPIALVESIASGVPVVASDLPGVRELITHGQSGWLVPPKDPIALGDAVIEALSNRKQARLLAQQARGILNKFSATAIVDAYQSLYRRLIQT